jgi:hypothetical protein
LSATLCSWCRAALGHRQLFEATQGSSASGTVYGAAISCKNGCPQSVLSITGNSIWSSHAPTTTAPGGDNTTAWYSGADQGASFPWGTNSYYPTWLKGVAYLSASGATLAENTGLITKPCDL